MEPSGTWTIKDSEIALAISDFESPVDLTPNGQWNPVKSCEISSTVKSLI